MNDDDLRALKDRFEIQDVLFRYARAADSLDPDLMRSAFHPGATDEHAGMFGGTIEDLLPRMMEMQKLFDFTQHAVSNIRIQLDGDSARSECVVTGTQGFTKDGKRYHWIAGGRYEDVMERRNGEWRIARRVTHLDYSRIVAIDPTLPSPIPLPEGHH